MLERVYNINYITSSFNISYQQSISFNCRNYNSANISIEFSLKRTPIEIKEKNYDFKRYKTVKNVVF